MKVAIFGIQGAEMEQLRTLLGSIEADFFTEELNAQTVHLAADAEIVSIFINSTIDRAVLDSLPKLKLIVARSTGYDNIDVVYAKERVLRCPSAVAVVRLRRLRSGSFFRSRGR
jgi:D-lactate dehydrogenase